MNFDNFRYNFVKAINTKFNSRLSESGVGYSDYAVSKLQLKRITDCDTVPLNLDDALSILQGQAKILVYGNDEGQMRTHVKTMNNTRLFANNPSIFAKENEHPIFATNDDGELRAWDSSGKRYRTNNQFPNEQTQNATVNLVEQAAAMVKKSLGGNLPTIGKNAAILDHQGNILKPALK